ncbi:unnamed protein product [Rhizophagus irregularis]|nr:unnamed protein product [Rhizophagus irregularis]
MRKERVSSLGMAISVISKNEQVSSFGIVIGNRGKCEVDTRIDLTHRLIWSITASVLIFGFGYIGFGFSFWVLDRYRIHSRQMSALALARHVG